MSSLMNIAPQKAVIAETGEVVDADEVKVNTILAVKAGEVIPIDGVVLDGNCEVDEKTLTGESFPVAKQKDSAVWAGTINLNGYVSVKTTALAEDCVVAKMAKLVEEAQNSKTSTQRLIDKFAKFYTPVISTLVAVIPIVLKVHNEKHWLHFALVILVSACPCALILSTPVATFCAYTKAATSGLLIKGGDYLETLAKVKVMAFDKTGTITKGEFVVTNFQSLSDDIDLNTLAYWVSSIESKSSHPLAAAIVDYGRSLSIEPKPEKVTEFENFPGEGICGKIDERVLYIGNKKIATRAGSETVPTLQGDAQRGKTTGYIFSGATPVGIFSLTDACRSGVQEAIGQLKLLGIKTAMLTGDCQSAAMQAQEQKCASQTCLSKCPPCPSNSSLCGSVNHVNIMVDHDQCKGSDKFHEPDHCHHRRCDKNQERVPKHDIENKGCLDSHDLILNAEDNDAVAIDSHGNCLGHKSHGAKHCHNQNVDKVTPDSTSLSSSCHLNLPCQKEGQQFAKHRHMIHGCENHKDHESRNMSGSNHGIQHKKSGCHSDFKKCGTGEISIDIINEDVESASMHGCLSLEEKGKDSCCKGSSDTCEKLPVVFGCESLDKREISACCRHDGSSKESMESSIMHACVSLDKREVGGCCKSYMKECCGKHGHSGAGFVGGLSEIITE
ncbi:P-type ATPase [Sesbania bispinosa]|nr:P-type ATPase [Sesbania bispinosa]